MKMRNVFVFAGLLSILYGCAGTAKVVQQREVLPSIQAPLEKIVISDEVMRYYPPKEEELKSWPHADVNTTLLPGMNLDAAYQLLQGHPSTTVTVGVIDSGVDINHEDLKDVIWTNPKEIAGNGIDDDKNGYVDDIHGWNFLGNINQATMELVRILQAGEHHPDYQKALQQYEEKRKEAQEALERYEQMKKAVVMADEKVKKYLKKENYTAEDLLNFYDSPIAKSKVAKNEKLEDAVSLVYRFLMFSEDGSIASALKKLDEPLKYYQTQIKYHLNKDFYPRKTILGDDENDFTKTSYGDNNVIGPELSEALHGTHVAGIIAAKRHNGIGMDGVADNVRIMCVRAVPDGDEYDKDVALAIRYAVDNGAKVLNTSFGKSFSPHYQKVHEAIKYAADHDVLIVNAAGNDSKDIDKEVTYPNDDVDGEEISDNMITVGALNYAYSQLQCEGADPETILAKFSNYGKKNVDIFAPGVQIYSTTPGNTYQFLQGTSMASPEVAGLAALIRSYFPKLTASEVKKVILESGLPYHKKIETFDEEQENSEGMKEDEADHGKSFSDYSKTGKFINAYNAVILASQLSEKK